MKHSISKIIFILFLISIGLAYNQWIFHWGILTYGDWYFFYKESLMTIRLSFFHLWISDFSLGAINIGIGQAPTYALYGIFASLFGWSYATSLRLIHLFPIIILTPLCSYILLWKLTRNKLASFVGMLVYSYNTYFLILQAGTVTLMAAFAFLPAIFTLYYLFTKTYKIGYALGTGLLLGVSCAYEPRVFYIEIWILFLYWLFTYLFLETKTIKQKLKKALFGFAPLLMGMLINFYWLFGLSHAHSLTSNVLFSRTLFGNEFLNILYAITLYHPFWSGALPAIFVNQKIPPYVWLIPIGAFLGLYNNKKNHIVLFFGMLGIIGILLTKQSGYPFNGVYLWLYQYMPGFNAFREASKFFGIIALSYSVLISFFITWLLKRTWKNILQKSIPYIVCIAFSLVFLLNLKPLLTGEIRTLFVERHIPSDYLLVKNKILSDKQYYRTLWIPVYSRWGVLTNLHPELSLVDLSGAQWTSFAPKNTIDSKYTGGELLAKFIKKKEFQYLTEDASIKYIFIPIEDNENDDNFFVYYGESRQYYIDQLDKISWLKRITIGTKKIVVYENLLYKPHIYISQKQEQASPLSYENIEYSYVNPSEYTFVLNHIKSPMYLNFSETYDPNWKIHIGSFTAISSLLDANYFLTNSIHAQNFPKLNSFYIDPKVVCARDICKRQFDGSYTIKGTLYFAPESFLDIGFVVSGTIALIMLAGLIIISIKNFFKKNA